MGAITLALMVDIIGIPDKPLRETLAVQCGL
jgi:hypothetical protein